MKKTPMMQQYASFKRQYPDKLVLFRMGDFYETFGDDAKLASKLLNITLTARNKDGDPTPLAGFPHHAIEQYLPKIVAAGQSAVIVEQLEDPKLAKGVVKRGVTRVVTPGTLDGELADRDKSSYVMSFFRSKGDIGIALCDISTGEFKLTQFEPLKENIESVLNSHQPAEILLLDDHQEPLFQSYPLQFLPVDQISEKNSVATLKKFFGVTGVEALGLERFKAAVVAAAMVAFYIEDTQKLRPEHIVKPVMFSIGGTMVLDRATIRNLDLIQNSYSSDSRDSLLEVVDGTLTRMGRRTLFSWILNPLIERSQIVLRHNLVSDLVDDPEKLTQTRATLSEIADMERLVGRIGLQRANARELKALQFSIEHSLKLVREAQFEKYPVLELDNLKDGFTQLDQLLGMLDRSVAASPPISITDGFILGENFDPEVDRLRELATGGKSWIRKFEEEERARTGITTLKVSYNKVFGFYIETTKTHQDKIPDDYIRKQTLVNSERYITQELKVKEEEILSAQEKLSALEYQLFCKVRSDVLPYIPLIKRLAKAIAILDVLSGFAYISRLNIYSKPEIYQLGERDGIVKIEAGRHPVVERLNQDRYVTNDLEIYQSGNRMCIITGPNMSGKSTFIRQVALIVLMAQIGCFVPALKAEISIVDRIFSRVGASDNLSQGRSTFMVEMEEAAHIVNSATRNSLIILDEVGRGTSTYDGVSIAWSLAEYLLNEVEARTLFATHYHELLKLAKQHPEVVKNLNVEVREDAGDILFMHKIVEGGTDRSYGIHVAKMAGLPESVIDRAKDILSTFEKKNGNSNADGVTESPKRKRSHEPSESGQFGFMNLKESELIKELEKIDIDQTTPVDALKKLAELIKQYV